MTVVAGGAELLVKGQGIAVIATKSATVTTLLWTREIIRLPKSLSTLGIGKLNPMVTGATP